MMIEDRPSRAAVLFNYHWRFRYCYRQLWSIVVGLRVVHQTPGLRPFAKEDEVSLVAVLPSVEV